MRDRVLGVGLLDRHLGIPEQGKGLVVIMLTGEA